MSVGNVIREAWCMSAEDARQKWSRENPSGRHNPFENAIFNDDQKSLYQPFCDGYSTEAARGHDAWGPVLLLTHRPSLMASSRSSLVIWLSDRLEGTFMV